MATTNDSSNKSISEKALNGVGNLIRLLPTGTVFLYQFLNPVLTNGGECSFTNKIVSSILFGLCGLSCFFSTFTDSYTDADGKTYCGIATFKGLWIANSNLSSSVDLSSYKLQVGDFVHAVFSLIVFCVISLLDVNTVQCFYPSFESTQKVMLMVLPPILGAVSGTMFVMFPNKRHGIGYPSNQGSGQISDASQKA